MSYSAWLAEVARKVVSSDPGDLQPIAPAVGERMAIDHP
jgi:hypothetical protein